MARALGRAVLVGVGLGLVWGVLARVFMRLIATQPGFSWAGTLGILAIGVVFWVSVGLVGTARARARSRWWRLAGVPALVLFAGQGLIFLPGALLVASGLAVRTTWQRVALMTGGLGGTYWLLTLLDDERFLQPRTQSLGFLLAVLCTAMAGVGLHRLLRRWPARTDPPVTAEARQAAYVH